MFLLRLILLHLMSQLVFRQSQAISKILASPPWASDLLEKTEMVCYKFCKSSMRSENVDTYHRRRRELGIAEGSEEIAGLLPFQVFS